MQFWDECGLIPTMCFYSSGIRFRLDIAPGIAERPLRGLLRSALVNWASGLVNWAGLGRPNELGRAASRPNELGRAATQALAPPAQGLGRPVWAGQFGLPVVASACCP